MWSTFRTGSTAIVDLKTTGKKFSKLVVCFFCRTTSEIHLATLNENCELMSRNIINDWFVSFHCIGLKGFAPFWADFYLSLVFPADKFRIHKWFFFQFLLFAEFEFIYIFKFDFDLKKILKQAVVHSESVKLAQFLIIRNWKHSC